MNFEDKMILSYEEQREIQEVMADKNGHRVTLDLALTNLQNQAAAIHKREQKAWDDMLDKRGITRDKIWKVERIGSFSVIVEDEKKPDSK